MLFVTGGTGLIGSNLLCSLIERDLPIVAIYRDESKIKKVQRLFSFYGLSDKQFQLIHWVECDILDVVSLSEFMHGAQEVYHCAAMVSFQKRDYSKMLRINKIGTANVMNVALNIGVPKVLHISSTAAIGKTDKDKDGFQSVVETNKWMDSKQNSGYAVSKYLAELEVWRSIEEGLNAVIINPSVIIGPGSWGESSMSIFRTLSKGLKFYTIGANAFVDVRDVVFASQLLMQNDHLFKQRYLCTGTNISFQNLFQLIAKELRIRPPYLLAGSFLSACAWRISWIISFFTGYQTVTKESAASAQAKVKYDSSKLRYSLSFEFKDISNTIKHAVLGRLD
jgi:dihydroflavonol-4-reductase